jgi:hypothetical protein
MPTQFLTGVLIPVVAVPLPRLRHAVAGTRVQMLHRRRDSHSPVMWGQGETEVLPEVVGFKNGFQSPALDVAERNDPAVLVNDQTKVVVGSSEPCGQISERLTIRGR